MQTSRLIIFNSAEISADKILNFYKKNFEFFSPTSPLRPPEFLSLPYWQSQIEKDILERSTDTAYRFWISLKQVPQTILGFTHFTQIFRGPFQACYLGYAIDQNHQNQGYTTEALSFLIQKMFHEHNLHRIMANHLPQNQASARVLEKLGFTVEGRARQYLQINGKWEDHILTSLTNPDWKEPGRNS